MERNIMWSPWAGVGLEHLHLVQNDEQIIADGLIIGVEEQLPFRVHYEIRCDSQWRLRTVNMSLLSGSHQELHLSTDGEGAWTTGTGESIPSLDGCLDVDISATPFTNTLPIRRLALKQGESVILTMAYIAVPQMHVTAAKQRYTCLEVTPGGGRYRYESLVNGVTSYMAELPVDADGLVLDYPELFRRVGAW